MMAGKIDKIVLVLEVDEGAAWLHGKRLNSLNYPKKYKGSKGNRDGQGNLVQVDGNKSQIRGRRRPRAYTVQTHCFLEDSPSSGLTPPSGQPSGKKEPKPKNLLVKKGDKDKSEALQDVEGPIEGLDPDSDEELKRYTYGNPNVELITGILHMYKDDEAFEIEKNKGRLSLSEMLVMLAVPGTMNCRELIKFVGPYSTGLENITIIHESIPNQYMVLLKFRSQKSCDSFYSQVNGTRYNSFEEDMCHLAYVSRVQVSNGSQGGGLPIKRHLELPICLLCLERMDESVDALLTILCNPNLDAKCLTKWSDISCPVCRYVQTPDAVANNMCMECGLQESIWMCLICGHVGCGRYVHAHAFKHFCETGHNYAIQPNNNRVWDYTEDKFVHRLLQNKSDGKLVEVAPVSPKGDDCGNGEERDRPKQLESLQLEYTYLLASQLEAQRSYFEEKLSKSEKHFEGCMNTLVEKLAENESEVKKLSTSLEAAKKDNLDLERKFDKMQEKLKKAYHDLMEEKEMNKCLAGDKKKLEEMYSKLEKENAAIMAKKDEEIVDLKEQVRDSYFYIQSLEKIEKSELKDEIQEGTVTVGPAPQPPRRKGQRKNR